MNATERSIFEQFPFWTGASLPEPLTDRDVPYVIVGCGTSYNLAMSVAAAFSEKGFGATAVPAGEWLHRPASYLPDAAAKSAVVIALSRSGESTETVQAAEASRARGQHVIGITCAEGSGLTKHSDRVIYLPTHAEEGIVMTASASLMLLTGFVLCGMPSRLLSLRPRKPCSRVLPKPTSRPGFRASCSSSSAVAPITGSRSKAGSRCRK